MADDHLHPHGNKPLQHHSDLGPGPRIDATAHREHFRLHEDPALLSSSVAPFESAAPAQNEQRFRRWCRGCSAAEAATTKRLRLWPLVAAIRRTQPRRRLAWRLLVRAESPAHRRNHGARGVQNRDLPMQSQPVSTALRLRLDARLRHAQRSRCCRCGRTTRRGAGDCMRGKGKASPEQPREPKQSCRRSGPSTPARARPRQAPSLLDPDSEQAPSRSCVGSDRIDGRRDLDHLAAARPGRSGHLIAAAVGAAPFVG